MLLKHPEAIQLNRALRKSLI